MSNRKTRQNNQTHIELKWERHTHTKHTTQIIIPREKEKKKHKIVMNPYAQLKCHFEFCVRELNVKGRLRACGLFNRQ